MSIGRTQECWFQYFCSCYIGFLKAGEGQKKKRINLRSYRSIITKTMSDNEDKVLVRPDSILYLGCL